MEHDELGTPGAGRRLGLDNRRIRLRVFTPIGMSPRRRLDPMSPSAQAALARVSLEAGAALREERLRRRWSLHELSDRAGVAIGSVQAVESGRVGTLETYARLASALALRPSLTLDPGRVSRPGHRSEAEDFVHAAMGEWEAQVLRRPGRTVAIDEPYQHYQFAGRADVLAWEGRDLLHLENRTRFPNVQDSAGSYNAKRQYLAGALADRFGVGPAGWRSVTHVMACLWSSEALHVLRLRPATFASFSPSGPDAFHSWLTGVPPPPGVTSAVVLLDPVVPFGARRRAIASLDDAARAEPRYRGYAEAADALRRATKQR